MFRHATLRAASHPHVRRPFPSRLIPSPPNRHSHLDDLSTEARGNYVNGRHEHRRNKLGYWTSSTGAILVRDTADRITYWNKAWSPKRPLYARVAQVVFLHRSFYRPVFRPVRVLNCSTN